VRRRFAALAALAAAVPALCAAAASGPQIQRAVGTIAAAPWPYFPGSVVPIKVDGFTGPYELALSGPGSIASDGYAIPNAAPPGSATLVAGNAAGIAARRFAIAAPPQSAHSLIAVASYDTGLVLHDARTFAVLGVLSTGGSPSDAAVGRDGRLAIADTGGDVMTIASLQPWNVTRVPGVPLADEVAIDSRNGNIFATNRDADGGGAVSRVSPSGTVARVPTGRTPEGLAIDARRGIVYVANTNDGTVAEVDARDMRVVRRFHAIDRVFSLALSPGGDRLYAVSNQSTGSPFGAAGAVVAFAVGDTPRRVARSADLTFPLGIALDARHGRLFVTDEAADAVDVLNARTLRAAHAALPTCRTPWKPAFDAADGRVYVPCARAGAVDVFDAATLRRIPGAPFRTGSYPLAVALWHPRSSAKPPSR
jgi:DNA-binding beta-propeller fold protein YncE